MNAIFEKKMADFLELIILLTIITRYSWGKEEDDTLLLPTIIEAEQMPIQSRQGLLSFTGQSSYFEVYLWGVTFNRKKILNCCI